VWGRYGGWYDGEPDNLLPAPRHQQAREWVELAGGQAAVLARARALAEAGDHRMACHLVEFAVMAEAATSETDVPPSQPEGPPSEAHQLRQEVYAARAATYESSVARNIPNHAVLSSTRGRRHLAGDY
jgi:alkyl sulfatase BDS1-like metallo-beta-lactamase superfamily hydrolase